MSSFTNHLLTDDLTLIATSMRWVRNRMGDRQARHELRGRLVALSRDLDRVTGIDLGPMGLTRIERFHHHVRLCRVCQDAGRELCPTGGQLLMIAIEPRSKMNMKPGVCDDCFDEAMKDSCGSCGVEWEKHSGIAVVCAENKLLRDWIREEGVRTDTCTYNVLGEVCDGCRCDRSPNTPAQP